MNIEGRFQLYGRPQRAWSKSIKNFEQLFSEILKW